MKEEQVLKANRELYIIQTCGEKFNPTIPYSTAWIIIELFLKYNPLLRDVYDL